VAGSLGPARGWDVFVTMTLPALQKAMSDEIDFAGLREAAEFHRRAAYAVLHGMLADPRYSRFLLSLGRCHVNSTWQKVG
jgi:hypothetical protein